MGEVEEIMAKALEDLKTVYDANPELREGMVAGMRSVDASEVDEAARKAMCGEMPVAEYRKAVVSWWKAVRNAFRLAGRRDGQA